MAYKRRKTKMLEYENKYAGIPKTYRERLEYLYDKLNITESKARKILELRQSMINSFYYDTISFVLYEVPAGKERPRFRVLSKNQLIGGAINNPNYIHVYSLSGYEDHLYMKRLVSNNEFILLDQKLCTPVYAEFISYFPTPKSYSNEKIFLAEIGLDRPLSKPDFDNIEKKYADMFNGIIWLDDIFVVDGIIRKFYSVLPRIEIRLHFMNQVYNKAQYNRIINRKDFTDDMKLDYFGGKENGLIEPISRIYRK